MALRDAVARSTAPSAVCTRLTTNLLAHPPLHQPPACAINVAAAACISLSPSLWLDMCCRCHILLYATRQPHATDPSKKLGSEKLSNSGIAKLLMPDRQGQHTLFIAQNRWLSGVGPCNWPTRVTESPCGALEATEKTGRKARLEHLWAIVTTVGVPLLRCAGLDDRRW